MKKVTDTLFIVDEVKNFAANNLLKLVIKSRTGICVIGQSRTGICASKGWRLYIEEFRGSEAIVGFCCEFIYGDCKVQGQRFCTRFETSLY